MLNRLVVSLLLSASAAMGADGSMTILDDKSPDFLLGKATRRGLLIKIPDAPDMSLSLGARMQGTVEAKQSGGAWIGDFYSRRIRLELGVNFSKHLFYYMDLRNDQANRADRGEVGMVIGNAYVQVKELFGLPYLNFQGFRGKVDVTRITTASSGQQLYYERPLIAESAQQYVSQNRRAANLQLFGSYEGKVRYQIAVGDGVTSTAFFDARGKAATSISKQDPMFGGKIVLSPIPGWEEKERTMTYFGRGHHAAIGVGYFRTNAILFKPSAAGAEQRADRGLLDVEASFAWGPLFLAVEYLDFSGVVEDFTAATLVSGNSSGWYATGEYVLTELSYLAPMFKYERWNRFRQAPGYNVESFALGVNWYLMGNSARVGLVAQKDWLESRVGAGAETSLRFTSQIHF